jgi:SAM-dependent methyltransferase
MEPDALYLEGGYLAANPAWHEEDADWKARQVLRLIEDTRIDPTSVVDVGCGTGGVLDGLASSLPSAKLVGYDVAPAAVAIAAKLRPHLDVINGDVRQSGRHFDLALLMDVFEHVPDYLGFLESMRGVADRFIFHIPLDMNGQQVIRGGAIMAARRNLGHLHYFSKETALGTLETAGYRVLHHRYTGSAVDLPLTSRLARLARSPRRAAFKVSPDLAVRVLGGYSLLVLAEPSPAPA